MRVWIVEDQDTGDNAATVVKVFADLEKACAWIREHEDEAFGYYQLTTPLSWDGTNEGAAFEVEE